MFSLTKVNSSGASLDSIYMINALFDFISSSQNKGFLHSFFLVVRYQIFLKVEVFLSLDSTRVRKKSTMTISSCETIILHTQNNHL